MTEVKGPRKTHAQRSEAGVHDVGGLQRHHLLKIVVPDLSDSIDAGLVRIIHPEPASHAPVAKLVEAVDHVQRAPGEGQRE
eukprot:3275407-Pyramimonas_sp.AAC.1